MKLIASPTSCAAMIANGKPPVHAATDVTGFGLIGHAREMSSDSAVSIRMNHQQIKYLPGAIDASRHKLFSGGLKNNRDFLQSSVRFASSVSEEFQALLFDPQTSGGLFVSIAREQASKVVEALKQRGVPAHVIGEVL